MTPARPGVNKTFLFYDIETSGRSAAFDQILQFAAIRTDLALNELARYELLVKLTPDVVPSVGASLTHQISITHCLTNGIPQLEAIQQIHQLVNTPGTISIGYNNLGFDDEFLRFAFYRHLLPPYTHQYANHCGRTDLYPIVLLYFLFKPEILQWPEPNGKPSLKLEYLSEANQLANGRAHDAMTDVAATLALARRLAAVPKIWQYALDYFDKKIATERAQKLAKVTLGQQAFPVALYVDGSVGYEHRFQCPVLGLGYHRHYQNQTLWLRLDKPELATTSTATIPQTTWVFRKKIHETGLLLPLQDRFLTALSAERQALMQQNQQWLGNNLELLQRIADYHLDYKYAEIPNLDVDAALYQNGFLTDQELLLCAQFHQAAPPQKAELLTQFQNPHLRTQAIRLLGRYYPDYLTTPYCEEYSAYLQKINPPTEQEALVDYRGQPRLTPRAALQEIAQLQMTGNLPAHKQALLKELADYLRQNF